LLITDMGCHRDGEIIRRMLAQQAVMYQQASTTLEMLIALPDDPRQCSGRSKIRTPGTKVLTSRAWWLCDTRLAHQSFI